MKEELSPMELTLLLLELYPIERFVQLIPETNVQKEHWDLKGAKVRASHSNALILNRKVTELFLKVQKCVIELEAEESFDFETLKERMHLNYAPQKQYLII